MKERTCKNCKKKFAPTYSTVQQVCSIECSIEYSKSKRKNEQKKKWKKEKSILKKKIETKTEVEKRLQKEINQIVRILDKGHPCISSGLPLGKSFDAGHLYSRGSNPQIKFHLMNIFAQTVYANQHQGGQPLEYVQGLEDTFGKEIKDYCLSLKCIDSINLSKEELRENIVIAKRIVKWLKLQDRKFDLKERISLRKKFNKEIGIYEY